MTWFKDNPSLLDEELKELNESGYKYEIVHKSEIDGLLKIKVDWKIDGGDFKLECVYPANYPYFAVRVACTNFPPGRHVNPNGGGICLFHEESDWNPKEDSLTKMIKERLPKIYQCHMEPNIVSVLEGNEGYQMSAQIAYSHYSLILTGNVKLTEEQTCGNMYISLLPAKHNIEGVFRGAVSLIKGKELDLRVCPDEITDKYKDGINARWVKLPSIPQDTDFNSWLSKCVEINPSLSEPHYKTFGKYKLDIIGVIFPEECKDRKKRDNWVFLVREKKVSKKNTSYEKYFIRGDLYTPEILGARTPRALGLDNKSALIIGTGALGSNVILQLAKSGIKELNYIDHDILQSGNLCRWLPSFDYIGFPKISAIDCILRRDYPFVKSNPVFMKIGEPSLTKDNKSQTGYLKELVEDVDLVIDCAAEQNVSLYMSDLCNQQGTDYLWGTSTEGAWGGIVGISDGANSQNIWLEFSNQYHELKINPPPAEENQLVQPVGCFHPTFTGLNFDLDEVSSMISRVAVSYLVKDQPDGYPTPNWNVSVLHLWDEENKSPVQPRWDNYKL